MIWADYRKGFNLNSYKGDGLIIHSQEFSCYNSEVYSLKELKDLSAIIKEHSLEAILDIDCILEEDDLGSLNAFLSDVYNDFDYFIFSDMAIFSWFEKRDLLDKLVYNPKTLIASSEDLSFYQSLGIKVVLTNELSVEEINCIASKGKICLEVFGYHQMFYSRRSLLSLYKKFFGLNNNLQNKKLYLKEEIRNDFYPIYESNKGTFIYTNYIYCLFEELLDLKNSIDIMIINGIFISDNLYLEVIDIYNELCNNNSLQYDRLEKLFPNLSKGFLKNKSVLFKRDENE